MEWIEAHPEQVEAYERFVRDVRAQVFDLVGMPRRRPGLSLARRLAHAERARRNLERFEREKREVYPDPDPQSDAVVVRVAGFFMFPHNVHVVLR